ncbi:MAG TPA: diguanylate cyclase, partial [Methylibium sp.]
GRVAGHDLLSPELDDRFARDQLNVQLDAAQYEAGQAWVWVDGDYSRLSSTPLSIRLRSLDEVNRSSLMHARTVAASASALGVLSLMALLLWLSLRTEEMLYYGLYVGSQALYLLYIMGEGFAFAPFSLLAPLGSLTWILPAVSGLYFSVCFFSSLMSLHLRMPRVDTAVRWLAVINGVLGIGSVFAPGQAQFLLLSVANLVLILPCLAMLFLAARFALGGSRHAQLFVTGYALLIVFTVLRTWQLGTAQVPSGWIYYGLPAAMVISALLLVAALAEQALEERRALAAARAEAERDPLTGVRNRRSIEAFVLAALRRAERSQKPMSLLYMDLDHFKRINDTHGHGRGDDCLQAFVRLAQHELREGDALGRVGGEEFLAVLRDTDALAARSIAERIRATVADAPAAHGEEPIHLTVSIGVACVPPLTASVDHVIDAADRALYRAKAAGRNRVEFFA